MTVRSQQKTYQVRFCGVGEVFHDFCEGDVVISDSNLARCYESELPRGSNLFVVEAGEGSKQFGVYESLIRRLAQVGTKRSAKVFAFGGGVVGDLAGFVAASYMRGLDLIQIPTSVLAMVDSSVGGKVGIDLPEGKNLVGAFWPPSEVRIPIETLRTLSDRHFINGTAEIWKYGWIMDTGLLSELEGRRLEVGDERTEQTIRRCIELKRDVVEADEHETTGLRAILNFGHTVGHAIEKELNYEGLLHGEAIAVGMVVESRLAEGLGVAEKGLADRVAGGLVDQGLPVDVPGTLDHHNLLQTMMLDKKASRDGLAFSLVSQPGECKLYTGVAEDAVLDALGNS